MKPSLSVIVPVHNAQDSLAGDVQQLLEILPDITPRFEIMIVDDASTDQTEEIAHELSREYPQLRVMRHQSRLGRPASAEAAMHFHIGDVVFVQDPASGIRPAEIRRWWNKQVDRKEVTARAEMPQQIFNPHLLDRLQDWGDQVRHCVSSQ